ncbi:MAG: GNAT family N-acetyltransferase [Mucilaginibacter sp.]
MKPAFTPFPELQTQRLLLRRLSMTDENEVFSIRSRENHFVNYKKAVTIDDAREFIGHIQKFGDTDVAITWAITFKNSPKLLGTIVYWNISDDRLTAEIGYELAPENQGRGIMNEAMQAVLDFGFNELGFQSIEAYTMADHARSLNLLAKFNFKPAPNLRNDDPEIIYVLSKPGS